MSLILRMAQLFLGAMLLMIAIANIAVPAAIYPLWFTANETAHVFGVSLNDFAVQSVGEGMQSFSLVAVAVPILGVIMIVEYLIQRSREEEGGMGYTPFYKESSPVSTVKGPDRIEAFQKRVTTSKYWPHSKTRYFVDGDEFEV